MATLALAAVGAAVGGSLLPTGIGLLGATISGATLGGQLGALAGSYVDNALFGASGQSRAVEGPRLADLHVTGSTEGAPLPRLYGRARLGGQVIWATDFEEEVVKSSGATGGGKGGALGGGGSRTTEYRYYANFAVALCEGPVTRIGRISDDTVESIYRARYWQPAECAAMPPPLALMHFDASVNHGVGGAMRLLQSALGVDADGEFGLVTRAAIGSRNTAEIITRYGDLRRQRYRALPHFWRFGKGWLRRVDATLALAETWHATGVAANTSQPTSLKPKVGASPMTTNSTRNDATKWWLQSRTIWGAIITAAATLAPVLGPVIGIQLPSDVVQQVGDQALTVIQALTGLAGTILTIYGRLTATSALTRRDISLRM